MTIIDIDIDSRETKIIDEMKKINFATEFEYKISNLVLGDFIIKTENLELIIERKTESDLISSILDGRHREQKMRLIEYSKEKEKFFVIYLIEQSNYSKKFEKQMESAIINLTFKYSPNFKVIYSKSIEKSVKILLNICKKIKNNELLGDGIIDLGSNSIIPKMKKGENYSVFEKMLCCIDGISPKIAKSITNTGIDSITKLQIIKEIEFENENNLLKDIQLSEKRKFSKLMFEKIKKELI